MTDWQDYDEWWVVPKSTSSKGVFHSGPDCRALNKTDTVAERSASYMQYHDPVPCSRCHEDADATPTHTGDCRTPLRKLVKEDGDV